MPSMLFGANATIDARDMAAYLMTLRGSKPQSHEAVSVPNEPSSEPGRKLYSELGCQACHWLPGDVIVTNDNRMSLANVADKWRPEALPVFLRSPATHYKWTRMPDFKLSPEESGILADYLLKRSDTNSGPPLSRSQTANASRGGQLVSSLGCLNCHGLEKAKNRFKSPSLSAVAGGNWGRACLAENPDLRGSAPDFSFSVEQRKALSAFAQDEFVFALQHDAAGEFASRQYDSLRCQACHPRDSDTDLLTQLTAADTPSSAAEEDRSPRSLSVHVGRPPLTFAGEKLFSGWVERLLAGKLSYKPRPELEGRMPAFPAYAEELAVGFAQEHGYPSESAPAVQPDPALAAIGHDLTLVSGGFSCVSCHNVGSQKALAGKDTATINFACVTERLRPSYYWRYVQNPQHLLPGTMMPKFIGEDGTTAIKSVFNGDPQRQFAAIWQYLLSLQNTTSEP
jgi:cytochrome c2